MSAAPEACLESGRSVPTLCFVWRAAAESGGSLLERENAVAMSSYSENHSISISALQNERDWLKELVRAELDAVRRGEGSMQAADDLSQRLNHVESRIVRFLMDFLSVA